MTYFEFMQRFPSEEAAISFIIQKKFPDGQYVCPKCGCVKNKIYHRKDNPKIFCCNNCKTNFSVLTGTIFERTHLDLRMWLYAINAVIISKKGISALQLQRELGMKKYESAWRMLNRIRKAISKDKLELFAGIVEIDETYVGGKPRQGNYRNNDIKHKRGRGTTKTPVVGIKERENNRVYAEVAHKNECNQQLSGKQLYDILDKTCTDNTTVMTDQFKGYNVLDKKNDKNFIRKMINHEIAYAMGDIHTNGIESFGHC
jgi:transposase-like protein